MWSHLLTFLGGPHACIGYRFSLVECVFRLSLMSLCGVRLITEPSRWCFHRMKALVFTLIRAFEFELAVPAEEIVPFGTFLQRPALRDDKEEGGQLPLLIRPYKRI